MSKKLLWPIVIMIFAVLAAVLVRTDSGWFLRPYLLFAFIAICPGMAIIGIIRLTDPLAELILAVALSLALGTLVSEIFVLTKHWSPPMILAVLIGISFLGAMLQIARIVTSAVPVRQ